MRRGDTILEWLDQCFCNPAWRTLFPSNLICHLDYYLSDHKMVAIHFEKDPAPLFHTRGTIPCFEELWLRFSDSKDVVTSS